LFTLNSVIPTGANHRESGDLRIGGTLCLNWSSFRHCVTGCEGAVEIESEWTARKRERAERRLCPAVDHPTQAKNRLEWATVLFPLTPGRWPTCLGGLALTSPP